MGDEVGVSLVASAGQAPFRQPYNPSNHPTKRPNHLGKTGTTINLEFADRFLVYVLGPMLRKCRMGELFMTFSRRVGGVKARM